MSNDMLEKIKKKAGSGAVQAFLDDIENSTLGTQTAKHKEENVVEINTKKQDKTKEVERDSEEEKNVLKIKEMFSDEEREEITQTDEQFWDNLKSDKNKPKKNKVLTTFYLDPDLYEIITAFYEIKGKGFKSKFINESIRLALKSYDIL